MTPQIFTVVYEGDKVFTKGQTINLMKAFFTGKDAEKSITSGVDINIAKPDESGNCKMPKGIWSLTLQLFMQSATAPTMNEAVVYNPNEVIIVNNIPITQPEVPKHNYAGSIYGGLSPIMLFNVAFKEDDTPFRIEITPSYKSNNVSKIVDMRVGQVVLRGQKIADLT